jgi:hypothetical protein
MTRAEAVALIKKQLDGDTHGRRDKQAIKKAASISGPWHYGKVELRELLDAIYGEATCDEEELVTVADEADWSKVTKQ